MIIAGIIVFIAMLCVAIVWSSMIVAKRAEETTEVKDLMAGEKLEKFREMLRQQNEQEELRRKRVKIVPKKIIVNDRKYYIELDKIHLVYEDDKLVGWYSPTQEEE